MPKRNRGLALTRGLGRGLGIDDAITSPTYTLAHQHQGDLRLHHLDIYRFEASAEILDVGLFELLDDSEAVTVIEWGDAIESALPSDHLRVEFAIDDDGGRTISLLPLGSWEDRDWEAIS